LSDISALKDYPWLESVNVSSTTISDLTPLGNLKYLVTLQANQNRIQQALEFDPPLCLQDVELSSNQIEEMGKFARHRYLSRLVLNGTVNSTSFLLNGIR